MSHQEGIPMHCNYLYVKRVVSMYVSGKFELRGLEERSHIFLDVTLR